MFERPSGGDRAVLVCLDLGEGDPAQRMDELEALAVGARVRFAEEPGDNGPQATSVVP